MQTLMLAILAAGSWPSPEASLALLPVPPLGTEVRIAIDAGHGAPGNTGNWGCHCQREADETLLEARALAKRLRARGFKVLETRTTPMGERYQARVAAIERFKPQLVVSLHTDARGEAWPRETGEGGRTCWHNRSDPGFSVLWSEEGPRSIVTRRSEWGRTLSQELRTAGFREYSGDDYGSLYTTDAEPGCFVDARPMKQRVYFLRATTKVPVVIIETHHALDPEEVARWRDEVTHDAFASAVASAALKIVENR